MVIHPAIQSLIDEIEEFRAKTGMSVTAFGTGALGDSNFIPDILRGGRLPSLKTMDRVRAFMSARNMEAA
ncbi:hypothetical protein [Bradyrhizobium sp. USDA 4452]